MKIVLITIGQPSTNPRLIKEANALTDAGHEVIVLYCFWIDWAFKADEKILATVKWKFQLVGGSPYTNRLLFLYTKIELKAFAFLNKWIGNKYGIAEIAQAKCYSQLLKYAKSIKADWYIGHILGSLPVAVKAALYNKAKAGFDFEDYHRAENESMSKVDIRRITYLENKYVPHLQYISTASPLIENKVRANFPLLKMPVITLLNSFPLSQQPAYRKKELGDNTLQLFWFSQTVGNNRGLEMLIDALRELNNNNIYLTLAGRYTNEVLDSFKKRAAHMGTNIHFSGIIPPEKLPLFASKFDVGLALEPAFSTNNDIALSNKIFTYLLAGNALLVSETSMQKAFIQEYKIGLSFPIDDMDRLKGIFEIYLKKDELDKQRMDSWQLANKTLNWENESKKLLVIIK
jgi:hypothetical protein